MVSITLTTAFFWAAQPMVYLKPGINWLRLSHFRRAILALLNGPSIGVVRPIRAIISDPPSRQTGIAPLHYFNLPTCSLAVVDLIITGYWSVINRSTCSCVNLWFSFLIIIIIFIFLIMHFYFIQECVHVADLFVLTNLISAFFLFLLSGRPTVWLACDPKYALVI